MDIEYYKAELYRKIADHKESRDKLRLELAISSVNVSISYIKCKAERKFYIIPKRDSYTGKLLFGWVYRLQQTHNERGFDGLLFPYPIFVKTVVDNTSYSASIPTHEEIDRYFGISCFVSHQNGLSYEELFASVHRQ